MSLLLGGSVNVQLQKLQGRSGNGNCCFQNYDNEENKNKNKMMIMQFQIFKYMTMKSLSFGVSEAGKKKKKEPFFFNLWFENFPEEIEAILK